MTNGDLVPDEFIIRVIEENLAKIPEQNAGVTLDGFPRTITQAEHLSEMLENNEKLNKSEVKVLSIDVRDDLLVNRITGRFSCANCNAGYHDEFKPTKEEVCDHCGSTNFIRRKDDNAECVKNRLKNYYNDTAPIIDFYKEKGSLDHIDGEQDMAKVYENLEEIILTKKLTLLWK